jgi:hypothetical protein
MFNGEISLLYKNWETDVSFKPHSSLSISGTDRDSSPENPSTYEEHCRNANNNALCTILDDYAMDQGLGENYQQRCCQEWSLCCFD